MSIDRLNFDELNEADLQELLAAQVPEGLRIDYKRDLYGKSDADKREVLKDISGFSNAFGGHLIIGIEEANGLPERLTPVLGANPDEVVLRMEQQIRSGIEPRIQGVRVKAVPITSGGHCFVVRVPRSWHPPHRVSAQGVNRYWIRNSSGLHEASVDELRTLFTLGTDALQRARNFRDERIRIIQTQRGARPLAGSGRIVLHILPLAAFTSQFQIELLEVARHDTLFRPMSAMGFSPRFNLEGFLIERPGEVNHGYTQLFRNGIVESARGGIVRQYKGKPIIPSIAVERDLLAVLPGYLDGLRQLAVPPPLMISLTFEGVIGAAYKVNENIFDDPEPTIDQDIVNLPESLIEEYGQVGNYHQALRPAIDAMWNTAGEPLARTFSKEGMWTGEPNYR